MRGHSRYFYAVILFAGATATAAEPGEKAETRATLSTGLGLLWECLPNLSPVDAERVNRTPAVPVQVRVSREFLERCVSEPIVRESTFEDEILGTSITGPAKMIAQVRIKLVPDETCGVAILTFEGNIESKTKGVHGPVVLYNDAQTKFTIQKRLVLDARGLRLEPMQSVADTDSQTTNIDSRLPGLRGQIARRVAAQRATVLREEADKIAADHTLVKLDAELTATLGQLLAPEKDGHFSTVLNFCNMSTEREARVRSTADYIEITLHHRDVKVSPTEFATPTIAGVPAVSARVHRDLLRTALLDPQLRALLAPLVAGTLQGTTSTLTAATGVEAHTLRVEWSPDRQWLLVEAHAPHAAR